MDIVTDLRKFENYLLAAIILFGLMVLDLWIGHKRKALQRVLDRYGDFC